VLSGQGSERWCSDDDAAESNDTVTDCNTEESCRKSALVLIVMCEFVYDLYIVHTQTHIHTRAHIHRHTHTHMRTPPKNKSENKWF
jgi:hypothetical protein